MNLYDEMRSGKEKYNNCDNLLKDIYGLDSDFEYDAIIVAPSWNPEIIFSEYEPVVKVEKKGPYYCGYTVEFEGKRFGYIQVAAGAANIIDSCLTLGGSKCKKVIFIGAAGALKSDIKLGDIVIPKYSIAGDGGSLYLYEKIAVENFRKKIYPDKDISQKVIETAKKLKIDIKEKIVYCTDSIFCEYYHLEDILSLGSEIIEMETAAFYRCMELIGKPGFALLCISDNSATNQSLVGKTAEDRARYHESRNKLIPELVLVLT
ncbi:MAG: phosphorylase [Spirochaetes bacterium]|nr:phosphorylase [Spirochaetota bacterium]